MVSKTTLEKLSLKKLSLGAAGAVWLAIGSMQSANAASVKGGSTFTVAAPPDLVYDGSSKVTTKKSSDDAVTAAITTLVFAGIAIDMTMTVITMLSLGDNDDGDDQGKVFTPGKQPTPVPTPALLPGLLALGLRMMHKRKSEQERVLQEA